MGTAWQTQTSADQKEHAGVVCGLVLAWSAPGRVVHGLPRKPSAASSTGQMFGDRLAVL